jgi:hypothetical protein
MFRRARDQAREVEVGTKTLQYRQHTARLPNGAQALITVRMTT